MPDLENLLNIEDEVTQVLSDLGVTAKLDEMDDFMNQNDLKVSITNESNAATTGLVTYTCTVKDKDNTALANRVVEWYKGTTLLGLDATDSNGISTFNHKVTEADIFDVHAVVRGTHAGDDIRMFVKDKNNLVEYDVWSGGDYNGSSISGLSKLRVNVSASSDYSHIGNKSMKVVRTGAGSAYVRLIDYTLSDESLIGSTVTISAYVYSPKAISKLSLLTYDSEDTRLSLNEVSSVVSENEQSLTVSTTIPTGTSKIRLNFYIGDNSLFDFIDDISFTIL